MARKRVKVSVSWTAPRSNPFRELRREFKLRGIEEAQQVIRDEAEILAAAVQSYIFDQEGKGWPELNAQYLRQKIRDGNDERKLIAYGDYVASIRAMKRAGGMKWEVGLPNENHEGSGLPLKELGRILEYGHKGFRQIGEGLIPPRPHWRPVWARWIKKVSGVTKRIQKQVSDKVFTKVKRKLGKKKVKL